MKASVFNEGNQLLRLKKADTGILRAELARVEAQWAELLTRIPVVQEKLHQVMCCQNVISILNWVTIPAKLLVMLLSCTNG